MCNNIMATIYLSDLNASLTLSTTALFSGLKVPLPVTTVPFVTGDQAGNISRDVFSAALKFSTTPTSGSLSNTSSGEITDITGIAKSAMYPNSVGANRNMNTSSSATANFLGQLSKEIFGSEHSADLFNNQLALASAYVSSVDTLDQQIEANTSDTAAGQVVNALMLEKSERFALKYNSSLSAPADAIVDTHTGVVFTGTTTGVAKTVTVEIGTANGANAVTHMIKEAEGHFVPGLNAAALTAANGVADVLNAAVSPATPTNLGRLHNDVSLETTGSGSGAIVNIAANGVTNAKITAITIVNGGTGYATNDSVTIPAGALGTGSGEIEFTVTADMLTNSEFKADTTDLLTAVTDAGVNSGTGNIAIVNPNSFTGVALQSGDIYDNDQTVSFIYTVTTGVITDVTFTNAGTRMKVGDTLRLPANTFLAYAISLDIILTENMISDYGTLLSGNADMIAAFELKRSESGQSVSTILAANAKPGTIFQLAGRKVGKNAVATINVTNSTTIESINFTNHGSGYRPGDTVTIPATTLGPASSAISFVVTERMLLESGGIGVTTALDVSENDNSRTNGTYASSPDNVTGYGSGSDAQFSVVVSNSNIESIRPTVAGKGYKVGDKLEFAANIGNGANPFTYTIPDGIINQRFAMGEEIKSTAGTGSGVGGIGGTVVVTIDSINSIQRATLNESLSSPTEVPLEVSDKIQILYTINSRTGQRNAADQPINVIYKTIFEFLLN